jgi:hypothetical protein
MNAGKLLFPLVIGMSVAISSLLSSPGANADTIATYINSLPLPHDEHWNDFSWEHIIDQGEEGVIDPGDVLEGVFNFESVGVLGGNGNRMSVGSSGDNVELTGYFRLKVEGVGGGAGGLFDPVTLSFGPDPVFEDIFGDGAMAAAFEDPSKDFDASLDLDDLIDSATNGTHLVTMGLTGSAGEGWAAVVLTDSIGAAASFGSSSFGFYQANLNRIITEGGDNALSAVEISQTQESLFEEDTYTDFSVSGQLYGTASGATLPISNSTDVFFTAVPEPSTLTLLTLSAFGLLAYAWQRQKRTA